MTLVSPYQPRLPGNCNLPPPSTDPGFQVFPVLQMCPLPPPNLAVPSKLFSSLPTPLLPGASPPQPGSTCPTEHLLSLEPRPLQWKRPQHHPILVRVPPPSNSPASPWCSTHLERARLFNCPLPSPIRIRDRLPTVPFWTLTVPQPGP